MYHGLVERSLSERVFKCVFYLSIGRFLSILFSNPVSFSANCFMFLPPSSDCLLVQLKSSCVWRTGRTARRATWWASFNTRWRPVTKTGTAASSGSVALPRTDRDTMWHSRETPRVTGCFPPPKAPGPCALQRVSHSFNPSTTYALIL